jgi:peptidoglycan/xylan/chitin deacetylase (PgdA/CDA1 family)
VRAVRDRVARRVDAGRMDALTAYAFAALRHLAYWRGARAGGGLDDTADPGLRILAYRAVEAPVFEEQIDALSAAGYTFIGAADLLEHLDGRPLPPRSALLTFDDASARLLTDAAPVLRQRGIPAVLCVAGDEIGGHGARGPMLTADQLSTLRSAGWEVASRGRRPAHLTALPDDGLRDELAGSRETLEGLGFGATPLLAYPYGEHDARVRDRAAGAGYAAALALTTGRPFPTPHNRYALPRVEVDGRADPAQLLDRLAAPPRTGARDLLRRELTGLAGAVRAGRVSRARPHHRRSALARLRDRLAGPARATEITGRS